MIIYEFLDHRLLFFKYNVLENGIKLLSKISLENFSVQGEPLNLTYNYSEGLNQDYILLVTSRGLFKFMFDISSDRYLVQLI